MHRTKIIGNIKYKGKIMRLHEMFRKRQILNPVKDIFAGIIVALVSIPISMGYASIAGLPSVYGLYGSLLPIIVFGILTTSPQFVVGVDAMPAAMVGGLLATEGIAIGSENALKLVPVISLLVAIWFVIFYFAKAGRIVKYISTPVMGGFISGVGITIIMMQIPKLFGGTPGTGEAPTLILNIIEQLPKFNVLSFTLGIGTLVIILVCKKKIPKVPMTVVMMFVGAILQICVKLDRFGVQLLPDVEAGLPKLVIPNLMVIKGNTSGILLESLSIALVIMAQTLLATGTYAAKYDDKIDNNKELLAYAGMNMAGALVGCCPVNGSVSRSKIADNSGARSQLMSIFSGLFILIILLFFTPYLKYLPVSMLTAIVMTALMGIIDVNLLKRLWKENRGECFIFVASMLAVLFMGTINGVIIGCLLSFWEVAVRAVVPPTAFVGRIPGHGNFHSLERNSHARPIKNAVIYRFSGNLFFANIDKFETDIENAIKTDTKVVIVDARGIGNIDITAVDRLISFNRKLRNRDIKFYITEHASSLNDAIRAMGGESLITDGVVRITITLALRDAGINKPYELDGVDDSLTDDYTESEEKLAEFEWAFGEEAEDRLKLLAEHTADDIAKEIAEGEETHIAVLEAHGATTDWGMLGLFDEHEFWDFLEARLDKLSKEGKISILEEKRILERIEARREEGIKRLEEINPKAVSVMNKHRERILEHLKSRDPELYDFIKKHDSKEHMEHDA